ncbi:ATPase P [Nibricoccus aquaticus]|uniref:ATPase P n=1 Tax=Nibricoccus aquaticus TaxID=2576891 RepID=A0A290QES9_9BACT|nr:heavy metal translocating P-type ATPase metal-binding domain-containing protein [Nibricoccus aquaticus]ATC65740.1 ATPase P [Nibricoccus aquaticus]
MSALPSLSVPVAASASERSARVCRHCGSPSFDRDFCCSGCAFVHRLIHDEGFETYYDLRDKITNPAEFAATAPRDHGWLASLQRDAQAAAGESSTASLSVSIQGISCVGCVWLIEKIFARQPGAGRIEVNAQTGQARLSWLKTQFDAAAFASELQRFNYLVGPANTAISGRRSESQQLARRLGLCTAFAMNVMLFTLPAYFGLEAASRYTHLFSTLAMGFATLSLLAGGGYFLNRAGAALRERTLHIDLPIALGIVGAFIGSFYGWIAQIEEYQYFDFVSGFIVLMLLGRWAQVAAVERNQRRLLSEQPAPPRVPLYAPDGSRTEVAPEEIRPGQHIGVASGQTIPVDGVLASLEATLGLAWINGESEPRLFRASQHVSAGAQNLSRSEIRVIATQPWENSLFAQLLKPVTRAAFRHRTIERVIQGYLIAIIGAAIVSGLCWWLSTGDPVHAGAVVTAVLVVSCPCALGLAFPLTDEIATVRLRRRGVFVRSPDLWPRLAKIDRVVFDKTGTLTLETPELQNPDTLRSLSTDARAALLTMVADSAHPVARCLHAELLALDSLDPAPGSPREVTGYGIELGPWRLGRADWAAFSRIPSHGAKNETALSHLGRIVATFSCTDTVRTDARREIAALSARGLSTTILSGDTTAKVRQLALELALPAHRAIGENSPREKAAWLDAHSPDRTLMLGDGANDSLAFDRALVRGTPVIHRGLLEQKADFYFLGRGIGGIRALFEVNDARARTHRALLTFMIAYNAVAVGLSVTGHMHPLLAAVLMPLSSLATLAIVATGLRPLRSVA